nr:RNA-directed DNA polymerase, eukaryota [Tanacetum cinerariifolium]
MRESYKPKTRGKLYYACPRSKPPEDTFGCKFLLWKEERVLLLVGSPGASTTLIYSSGSSSTPIYSPGSSTPPRYSPVASTPQSYSLGTSRNAECSNCKHLLDKITVLEEMVDMYMHPEQHTVNSAALFHEVIKAFLGNEAGIDLGGCQTSGTWAKVMRTINHLHSSGIVPLNSIHFKVADGSSIRFWKDTWLGNDPLYIRYNRLFHLKNNKDCLISQRILNGSWEWDWCRPIAMGRSKTEFHNLIIDISNMEIDDLVESDTCVWSLSNDDSFSINSVRKHIDEHSLSSLFPCTRWYTMIPKKFPTLAINVLKRDTHACPIWLFCLLVTIAGVSSQSPQPDPAASKLMDDYSEEDE